MTVYVALLRAVNVGGTGRLPMSELVAFCEDSGFTEVRTCISSGNAVFRSRAASARVKTALERRLAAYAGKPVTVAVRTAAELAAVMEANPFPDAAPARTLVTFLDDPPAPDTLSKVRHRTDERIALGAREIYVAYGAGMAASKLVIPAAKAGTARNVNTIAKLVAMTQETAR